MQEKHPWIVQACDAVNWNYWELHRNWETNYITWPLNEMPSSLSTGIIGGAYGGTLGRAAKWDGLAEGSLTLSWETNTKII